ncbi:hypothetical protein L0U85_18330 [Glycomyces sp. L485]|uniref:hypothetical protein n=1 Tax=Glycomyces sp. L485 TaxID=2909235 RepID=UPI001F4A4A15|nr:hypothetical protein [Glycomyces sp. L485]MCH7232794.1 hypothetical protein [Glycomyces sp. L485]
MSRHTYSSTNGTTEYELSCDGCGADFFCRDDSYFSWRVLCAAAEAEGWSLHSGSSAHLCTVCMDGGSGTVHLGGLR